jgi:general secretion pathway protein G
MKMNKRKKNQKGFTLIEIMIVLAIVGMLFSFVGVNVIKKFRESKTSAAKIQMASYEQALQAYYLAHSMYPSTAQGLQALITVPTVGRVPKNYPEGGYFGKKALVKDPFGDDYRYECEDNQNYTISSDGPDGTAGTDDDIVQE